MKIILALILLVPSILLFAAPTTWLAMLALGNFGFSEFGYWDCLPAGILLGVLSSSSSK